MTGTAILQDSSTLMTCNVQSLLIHTGSKRVTKSHTCNKSLAGGESPRALPSIRPCVPAANAPHPRHLPEGLSYQQTIRQSTHLTLHSETGRSQIHSGARCSAAPPRAAPPTPPLRGVARRDQIHSSAACRADRVSLSVSKLRPGHAYRAVRGGEDGPTRADSHVRTAHGGGGGTPGGRGQVKRGLANGVIATRARSVPHYPVPVPLP